MCIRDSFQVDALNVEGQAGRGIPLTQGGQVDERADERAGGPGGQVVGGQGEDLSLIHI